MNLELPFNYQNEIKTICKDFLQKFNLNYFGFLRCYADNSCITLSTFPELNDFLIKGKYPLTPPVPTELIKTNFHYLVPFDGPYQKVMHTVAANFNLFKPLDIIFQYDGYYEMFCYGINRDDTNIIALYINHLHEFHDFSFYFKKQAYKIIEACAKKRISTDSQIFTPVNELILPAKSTTRTIESPHELENAFAEKSQYKQVSTKKIIIKIGNKPTILSKREYDCLVCLLRGKTAQQTADELFLSKRTVEAYLDSLKQKMLVNSKMELLKKAYSVLHERV